MFYTGLDPYTLKPVFVEKTAEGKALQRALLQYYEPRNAEKVRNCYYSVRNRMVCGFSYSRSRSCLWLGLTEGEYGYTEYYNFSNCSSFGYSRRKKS